MSYNQLSFDSHRLIFALFYCAALVFLYIQLFLSAITNLILQVAGSETSKPQRNFTLQTAASRGLSSEGIILQNDGCAYLFTL